MPSRPDSQQRLKEAGLRVTAPRIAVLEALDAANGHVTADQVWQAVLARLGSVSVQTIYDILSALTAAGLVRCLETPGQAAFEPSAIVPGIGFSPATAPNMRRTPMTPFSDETGPADEGWEVDGEMMRSAYALRQDDDDFSQAGTMVREVFDDAARDRFVGNVAGHILGGVKDETLPRVFDYWRNVESETGKRIEEAVRAGQANPVAPHETPASGVIDFAGR